KMLKKRSKIRKRR
ncbi:hypothetical protein KGM_214471B, partial [Danaus plexippus plexippus]